MPKYIVPSKTLRADRNRYPGGHHVGAASLTAIDADLIPINIVTGKTIFGVAGITVPKIEIIMPATLRSTDAEIIVTIDQFINKNALFTSEHKQAYDDQPANMIKRLTSIIASVDAEAIVTVDKSFNKNVFLGSDLSILVDGFVEETAAGVQTDKTAQARSVAANDLNLCPMTDTVLDKIYIGSKFPFYRVWMNYGTAGVGNWTNAAYYWNGAWAICIGEDDQTSDFQATAGIRRIDHTPQGDWALSVIQAMNLYWMMIRTDNFVNRTTKPLGTQIFVSIA